MNTPFVSLCPEITRANALTLMDWLEDEDVTRFLSDSRHVSRLIEQVIGRVQLPILTHLFNQGGRFFMAYDRHDVPVGFVRLVKSGRDCEMVLVIGDRWLWKRTDLTDYAVATYALTYSLRLEGTGSTEIQITASESGSEYRVEGAAATTAGYSAGWDQGPAYITRTVSA